MLRYYAHHINFLIKIITDGDIPSYLVHSSCLRSIARLFSLKQIPSHLVTRILLRQDFHVSGFNHRPATTRMNTRETLRNSGRRRRLVLSFHHIPGDALSVVRRPRAGTGSGRRSRKFDVNIEEHLIHRSCNSKWHAIVVRLVEQPWHFGLIVATHTLAN